MKFLYDNWSLLVILAAFFIVGYMKFRKFAELPSQEQQAKIKEWLLYAVITAEKEYSQGTGKLKLAFVWSLFLDKFPSIAPVITFEIFSKWVDEALVEMRKLLETNKDIESYVKD